MCLVFVTTDMDRLSDSFIKPQLSASGLIPAHNSSYLALLADCSVFLCCSLLLPLLLLQPCLASPACGR
jgi:hypothetical protein